MKRKIAAFVMSIAMVFSLAACGGGNEGGQQGGNQEGGQKTEGEQKPSGKAVTLKCAFNQTEDHPQFRAMQEFSTALEEKTNGAYKIQVFPNETLGPQAETMNQCRTGAIDMAIVGNSHLSALSDYYKTFDMPFLFNSKEHAKKFIDESEEVAKIYSDTEQYGVKVVAYFTAGVRNMYTKNKAISSVADMKNLKIRTMESDTYAKMMENLGGKATPMSMGEVYTAIQSGVVDGAENNEVSYVNSKHYEVAPYYSMTQHLIVPDWLVINKSVYDSFPDDVKTVFDELSLETQNKEYQLWDEEVEKLMATLDTSKVTITTDVDVPSFQDAVKPLHDELTQNEKIKEVYDAVRAVQ